MLILAMDTTSRIASAALCRDGAVIGYGEKDSQMNHSRTILPVVAQLMEENGCAMGDVDVFAATVGPGSFTGVRIGVAAIKGYAWSTGKPCAAVSTLESAAWAAKGRQGTLCAAVKARQDEFFYGFFRSDGALHRLKDDGVDRAAVILAQLAQLPQPIYLTGDGADELYGFCAAEGAAQLQLAEGCRQNAAATALCAVQLANAGRLVDCHGLKPSYLRLSQAERMKQNNKL